MKDDFANAKEIENASQVLLPKDCFFDDEKIKIIKCNESKDIEACPGSGKTTTLLAKLLILANRMPLDNNRGICVLTHTNVAIDEIKEKLGSKAEVLFKYPNHFGTIQSFVDKFLAIPFVLKKYNKKIYKIDNDKYKNEAKSFYNSLEWYDESNGKLKNYLYQKGTEYNKKDEFTTEEKNNNAIDLLFRLVFKDKKIVYYSKSKEVLFLKSNSTTEAAKLKYNTLLKFRESTIQVGCIKYDDAYVYGTKYINENSELIKAFCERFKYVFIDEMQDTNQDQLNILEKLFDKEKTIIQRFGDPHQAIYNNVSEKKIWEPEDPLKITGSMRFGENIAKILRTVCDESNADLKGNDEIKSLQPIMLVYDNPQKVLPRFCELLTTRKTFYKGEELTIWEISQREKKKIKAIGWVGEKDKESKKITIQQYLGNYRKDVAKKAKVNYEALKSFIVKRDKCSVKEYSDKIIEAFLHVLRLDNIKRNSKGKEISYTKTSFCNEFNTKAPDAYSELRAKLAKWSREIQNSSSYNMVVLNEICEYIKNDLKDLFEFNPSNTKINSFLTNEDEDCCIPDDVVENNNIYKWEADKDICIEVANIHKVKGETHTATLYLETYYQKKYESTAIKKQLHGIPYSKSKTNKDTYIKEALKMAHVGMSRPKYLLCMAVHKDNYKNEFKECGLWEIVDISESCEE